MSFQSGGNTIPVSCKAREKLGADLDEVLTLLDKLNKPPKVLEELKTKIQALNTKPEHTVEEVAYFWKAIRAVTHLAVVKGLVQEQETSELKKKVTEVLLRLQRLENGLIDRYGTQLCNPDVQLEYSEVASETQPEAVVLTWWTRDKNGIVNIDSFRRIPYTSYAFEQIARESTAKFIERNDPSVDELWKYLSNVRHWRRQVDEDSSSPSKSETVYNGLESHLKFALSTTASPNPQISIDEREAPDLDGVVTHLSTANSETVAQCLNVDLIPAFSLMWALLATKRNKSNIIVSNLVHQWREEDDMILRLSRYKSGMDQRLWKISRC